MRPQGGEQVVRGPKNETWPRWRQAVSSGSRRRQGGRRKRAVYLGVWTSVYSPGEDIFGLEDESNTGSKKVIPEAVAERAVWRVSGPCREQRGGGEREDTAQAYVVSTSPCSVRDPRQLPGILEIQENGQYMSGTLLGRLESLSYSVTKLGHK